MDVEKAALEIVFNRWDGFCDEKELCMFDEQSLWKPRGW